MTAEKNISMARRSLAKVWFIGSGALFFLVFLLSASGRFGDRADEAWAWFLPTIMPTLSLIIGVYVIDAVRKGVEEGASDLFFFKLTYWLSLSYLTAVILVLFLPNFAFLQSGITVFEFMNQANLWLGPFQGLVAATMGAFFVKKSDKGGADTAENT